MFGYVFAAFSEIGHAEYVFTVNGVSSWPVLHRQVWSKTADGLKQGIAMVSFVILFFVRMPGVPGEGLHTA